MKIFLLFLLINLYLSMKLSDIFSCNNVDNVIEPVKKSDAKFLNRRDSLDKHRSHI